MSRVHDPRPPLQKPPDVLELDEFFNPRAVAIVGALSTGRAAGVPLPQLQERWGDRFFLVNPRGGVLDGHTVYPSVDHIPGGVDVAVISVGIGAVDDVVRACGRKGVRYAVVFTAGYSETGAEGAERERELGKVARESGVRILGPNTNTNAFEVLPEVPDRRGGKIGLITHSGGQGRPLVQGTQFGVAFSRWIPTGNEVDLEAADFIEYFAFDDDTTVIAGYFEGFKDGAKLRRALGAANRQGKPVIALTVGSTDAGAKAAISHTGHLMGSDRALDGLFAQYGVTRVWDLDELLETAALFAKLPAGTGGRVCCYTGSGGSGALMMEQAALHEVSTPLLSEETQAILAGLLPGYLGQANPVDNGTVFGQLATPEERRRVLEAITADPATDIVVVGIPGPLPGLIDNLVDDLRDFAAGREVPIAVVWNSPVTDTSSFEALVQSGLATFRSSRNCFSAVAAWARYQEHLAVLPRRAKVGSTGAVAEREADLRGGKNGPDGEARISSWSETRELLERHGVDMVPSRLVDQAAEAEQAAAEFAGPVVMKISSAAIPHKSELGLVRMGVVGPTEAHDAFEALVEVASAHVTPAGIEGVLVQPQLSGVEMIVGLSEDPVLGRCLLVGSGGIFAEILEDVAVRPLPVDGHDIDDMLRSLKGFPVLRGVRGRAAADMGSLRALLRAVCELAEGSPDVVQLDLNPVVVNAEGSYVVDALVVSG